MATLLDGVEILQNLGVYTTLLPFILIFAVAYGILDKTKILGKNKGVA